MTFRRRSSPQRPPRQPSPVRSTGQAAAQPNLGASPRSSRRSHSPSGHLFDSIPSARLRAQPHSPPGNSTGLRLTSQGATRPSLGAYTRGLHRSHSPTSHFFESIPSVPSTRLPFLGSSTRVSLSQSWRRTPYPRSRPCHFAKAAGVEPRTTSRPKDDSVPLGDEDQPQVTADPDAAINAADDEPGESAPGEEEDVGENGDASGVLERSVDADGLPPAPVVEEEEEDDVGGESFRLGTKAESMEEAAEDPDEAAVAGDIGHGPDGSAEVGYQISLSRLLEKTGAASAADVPSTFFEGLRAHGVTWVVLTGVPDDVDLSDLTETASGAGISLRSLAAEVGPYAADLEGVRLVQAHDMRGFGAFVGGLGDEERRALMHVTSDQLPGNANAALLFLPGLRVFREEDEALMETLLPVITRRPFAKGVFAIPEVERIFGDMVVWKYVRGKRTVLVCLNYAAAHAVANVVCPEAPDVKAEGKYIDVIELLSETIFRRVPAQMRGKGLHVILHENEVQVFEY